MSIRIISAIEVAVSVKISAPENLYETLSIIANTFVNTEQLSSCAFLHNAFHTTFNLIPEAEKGSIFIKHEDLFRPMCAEGYPLELLNKLSFTADNIYIGFEEADNASINVYETYMIKRDESKFSKEIIDTFHQLGTYSNFVALYAPIVYDSKPIGLLSFENFNKKSFSPQSREILKIYAQMISNFYSIARQKELEKQLFNETIESLVSAIEINDTYTEGHGKRVMQLSQKIALAMNLPFHEVENIRIAALLHDIGKIGIPAEILNKPGKLTDVEYELVKTHPEKSKHVLSKISNFSEILDLVHCHHEYYDGSGYPNKLLRTEVPFGSHIIMVADAFDAMTSKRAYRDKMTVEKALAELKLNSGKQFHPDVVAVALKVLP